MPDYEILESAGTLSRTGWRSGPWDNEPDKIHWKDAATGLDCLVVRNKMFGNLCGYVGLPKDHSVSELRFSSVFGLDMVHGGITFSEESRGRISLDSQPELWWIGFDCAHGYDVIPNLASHWPMSEYRTLEYVISQCEKLAAWVHTRYQRHA